MVLSVGGCWKRFLKKKHDRLAVVYETADPGKFPDDIMEAIGIAPDVPERIAKQSKQQERTYSVDDPPEINKDGSMVLSDAQYEKAKEELGLIFA